ncbi:MAG: hypothetical protein ABH851_01050 [Methanobacteriota archaeon]
MDVIGGVRDFLSSDFNKALVVFLLVLGGLAYSFSPAEPAPGSDSFIHFFFMPTCPHCQEQHEFNERMEDKFGINILEHDVTTTDGGKLFTGLCGQYNLAGLVPTTVIGDSIYVGFNEEIGVKIENAIKTCLSEGCQSPVEEQCEGKETFVVPLPFLGERDLREYSLLTLSVMVGLIDGFNPCAMWVLVYLIAIVMELKNRNRAWLLVFTFVAASGILYFLFMTAWLNAFLIIGYLKIVTILVGLAALGGGTLNLKEYVEKRGAIECKVGDADSKKKTMGRINELLHSPLNLATLLGIIALAFVVNSIEFACSAALPAVFTQVLALSNLNPLMYYFYIAVYDVFFMLDDFVIFSLAVLSVNSMASNEKYMKISRVLGGLLMIGIGIVLLFAPQMLR